jgi:hypothetical protein
MHCSRYNWRKKYGAFGSSYSIINLTWFIWTNKCLIRLVYLDIQCHLFSGFFYIPSNIQCVCQIAILSSHLYISIYIHLHFFCIWMCFFSYCFILNKWLRMTSFFFLCRILWVLQMAWITWMLNCEYIVSCIASNLKFVWAFILLGIDVMPTDSWRKSWKLPANIFRFYVVLLIEFRTICSIGSISN